MISNNKLCEISNKIQKDLNNKDVLIYAFNSTGKTRLTGTFNTDIDKNGQIQALCYNSIVEDFFIWNNEEKVLTIDTSSWLFKVIDEEELDMEITKIFSEFIDIKIDPNIEHKNGKIIFHLASGDDETNSNIKISRGEETLFKWVVFFVVLQRAIDLLLEKPEDRSTHIFDNLKYILIDDPVSSLDDYKIYTLSNYITNEIKLVHSKSLNIRFLILTHHTLFFNIVLNSMKNYKNLLKYVMVKYENEILLNMVDDKTSLVQHIHILKEIKLMIDENTIDKGCFNKFRSVVEKMTVILGYGSWVDLLKGYDDERKFTQIINMNSHERYSEIQINILPEEQKLIFADGFKWFINKYNFNI